MKAHFFSSTGDHLFTAEISDIAPEKGDVFSSFDGKNYIVVQRTFLAEIVEAPAPTGIINIAATPTKQLSVEVQILMMEISADGTPIMPEQVTSEGPVQ